MNRLYCFLILLFLISCANQEYKTIQFRGFELTVPQSWEKYNNKGIDSYVGGIITDENDTLSFDLGMYSGDFSNAILIFTNEELESFSTEKREKLKKINYLRYEDLNESHSIKDYLQYTSFVDSIDCFVAKFIQPKYQGFGWSGIYIDSMQTVREGYTYTTKLSFYGEDLSNKTQTKFFKALQTMKLTAYCID
ncbi:MAG: hypothetical protein AAF611_02715 [Bacteroidota bacterium]